MIFVSVQEFVKSVLDTIPKPYGADVIDRVFQAIEQNPDWLEAYNKFSLDHGKAEVNTSIGFNVMGITGMKSLERNHPSSSSLIENYTELGHPSEPVEAPSG